MRRDVVEPDEVEQPLGVVGIVVERGEQPQRLERPQARVSPPSWSITPMRGRSARAVGHRVEPEHAHLPRVGAAVALEDLDRRRLARAVGPEQAEHLAGRDRERDPVDGARGAVALLELGDLDRGRRRLTSAAEPRPGDVPAPRSRPE